MFEGITGFFKRIVKNEQSLEESSKDAAKERLHLVLMQDRANVSADFLELMKQEIIEVIKKYIDVDEEAIDVRLTNQPNEDGTNGAPALYANIPIVNIKNNVRQVEKEDDEENVEEVEQEEQELDAQEEQEPDVQETEEQEVEEQELDEEETEAEDAQETEETSKEVVVENTESSKDKNN